MYKKKATKYDELITLLNLSTYVGSYLSDLMISFAASTFSQYRYAALATIIPLIVGSVLGNSGIEINSETLVNVLPSHKKIKQMVEQKSIQSYSLRIVYTRIITFTYQPTKVIRKVIRI